MYDDDHIGIKGQESAVCKTEQYAPVVDIVPQSSKNIRVKKRKRQIVNLLYQCEFCGKKFPCPRDIKRHRVLHTGVGEYSCRVCQKSFGQQYHLQRHMIVHSDARDFLCPICGKAFRRSGDQLRHTRDHTEARNFKCNICEASFKRSSHLKTHMNKHIGESLNLGKFKCTVCNQSFVANWILNQHVKKKHNVKDFKKAVDTVNRSGYQLTTERVETMVLEIGFNSSDHTEVTEDIQTSDDTNHSEQTPDIREENPIVEQRRGVIVDPERGMMNKRNSCNSSFKANAIIKEEKTYYDECAKSNVTDEHLEDECAKSNVTDEHLEDECAKSNVADEHLEDECAKSNVADEHLEEDWTVTACNTGSDTDSYDAYSSVETAITKDIVKKEKFDEGSSMKCFASEEKCIESEKDSLEVKIELISNYDIEDHHQLQCKSERVDAESIKDHSLTHFSLGDDDEAENQAVVKPVNGRLTRTSKRNKRKAINVVAHTRSSASESKKPDTKVKRIYKRPYQCEYCGKRVPSPRDIRRHIVMHTGKDGFMCTHCGKQYGLEYDLKRHMLMHKSERNFLCQICGKSFRRAADQARHMRDHSDTRRFECKECSATFKRVDHLKTHMNRHVPQDSVLRKFRCTVCDKGFISLWILNFHVKQKHPK